MIFLYVLLGRQKSSFRGIASKCGGDGQLMKGDEGARGPIEELVL